MHSFAHHHKKAAPRTRGIVMTTPAWFYDLMTRLFIMGGREQTFRRMTADLVQLQPGEAVLDVGCGTGTLALIAKERVGETGRVSGIDPSVQMLSGARRKAARRHLSIDFQLGSIEQIPLPDQTIDVVLNTFMMHHLPDDIKSQGLAEIARVLRPGGRLLIVDFERPADHPGQPVRVGTGEMGIQELPALMKDASFAHIEAGEIPFKIRSVAKGHKHYSFVLGRKA